MVSYIIREGDSAVLEFNNSFKTFVTIKKGSKVKIGKALCSLEPLIGQYYGIQFALAADGQTLEMKRPALAGDEDTPKEWDANGTMDKNNSELLDRGNAHQNLKPEDIEAMRASGLGGEAIVEALLANSETYESKTHFAQAKYRKRKAEKYMAQATLVRPTARSLAEAYFARSPQKIQGLRADSLALLLSLANIGAHARVLVVETCSGLVTGAVAERLGGSGLVMSGYSGLKPPSLDIVRQFNFPASTKAGMVTAPIKALLQHCCEPATAGGPVTAPAEDKAAADWDSATGLKQDTAMGDTKATEAAETPTAATTAGNSDAAAAPEAEISTIPTEQPASAANVVEAAVNGVKAATAGSVALMNDKSRASNDASNGWNRELPEMVQQACRQGFGCCILAAPQVQPLALLRKVLPLLAPSAAFAIFANCLQPLADCMLALQVSKEAVSLQLQESWWREHQVLPGRTHPEMVVSATGGYILTGLQGVEIA